MKPHNGDPEIDLTDLALTFWKGRNTLLISMLIFACVGLLIALLSPVQYTAGMTMVPQADNRLGLNNLPGLASIAGLNLKTGTSSDVTPEMYPEIVYSVPFQIELMKTKLTFSEMADSVTVYDYFTKYYKSFSFKKYTIGLPWLLLKAVRGKKTEEKPSAGDDLLRLSEEQRQIQKKLKELIKIDYDEKEGYLMLSCTMPEATPAAQLARRTQELLQEYITRFKVQKSTVYFNFVEQHHDKVKMQYNQAQETLARFRDQNKNVTKAMAQTELERLSNDYNLAFTIYSELARMLEQARMQIKEDIPVFTVIEPVSVPNEKSKPRRSVIFILWTFFGALTGTVIILLRKYIRLLKAGWHSKKINYDINKPAGKQNPENSGKQPF